MKFRPRPRGDERCRAAETNRKGKGKGNGGKGEHEGKGGGVGRKGTQQVENLVMDEVQENMRTTKEKHWEDVKKVGRDDAEGGREAGRAAGPSGA